MPNTLGHLSVSPGDYQLQSSYRYSEELYRSGYVCATRDTVGSRVASVRAPHLSVELWGSTPPILGFR